MPGSSQDNAIRQVRLDQPTPRCGQCNHLDIEPENSPGQADVPGEPEGVMPIPNRCINGKVPF
jgi:hypothetical protein